MRRRRLPAILVTAALVASLSVVSLAPPAAAGGGMVSICWVPAGRDAPERDLTVSPTVADWLLRVTRSYPGVCAAYGGWTRLGAGRAQAYTQSRGRVPIAIGVVLRRSALEGLPQHPPTDGTWCYDVDGDGRIDEHLECTGGYEHRLRLSGSFRSTVDTPFQYVLLNWNPLGHLPVGAYDVAHFDVHFYLNRNAERLAIRPGPCGLLVNCEDWEVGRQPLAPQHLPADYSDFGAVEPGMGNHLIDLTSPELNGQPFTHTFIYGSYGGKITFMEPMVAHRWLRRLAAGRVADTCAPIKQPAAWQRSGWYPTRYCLRHRANREEITVTLEGFVHRVAG